MISASASKSRRLAKLKELRALFLSVSSSMHSTGACDVAGLLELAQRHRMHPLLIGKLESPSGQSQSMLQQQVLVFFAQVSETVRLCDLLETAGLQPIALKGCALAAQVYPARPELRTSIDIDLLVAPESFSRAERCLADAGYQRTTPEPEMPQSAQSMARLLLNAHEYWNAERGMKVELHHRLLLDPFTLDVSHDVLCARAERIEVAGAHLRVLGKTDLALYLVCHGAGHLYARMKWLLDVALLLDTMTEHEISSLVEQARHHRCLARLGFTLGLIETLSDRQYGPCGVTAGRQLVQKGHSAMLANERPSTGYRLKDVPADVSQTFTLFRLAEKWPSRAFSCLQLLCNHKDLSVLGLGSAWAPLYALLGRPLALWRLLRRGTSEPASS